MIDFERIVEGLLFEQEPADTKTDSQESLDLTSFLEKKYEDLRTKWTNKYKDVYFPSKDELTGIVDSIVYGVPRYDKDFRKFPKFYEIFPLLDLIASLYTKNFKKGMPRDRAESTYLEFTNQLIDKNTPAIPLDFPTKNSWTKDLKVEFFRGGKTELGNLVVEDLIKTNPNMSFYQAIYRLLEIRKKTITFKLPDKWKNISGETFIQNVFFKINDIASSNPKQRLAIRDEKIRKIYDDVTSSMLFDVALAAYKLFEQQARANLKPEEVATALKDENLYKQFMGATGSKPMIWKPAETPMQPVLSQQNASFDQTYELSYKQMLNEKKSSTVYKSDGSTITTTFNPDGSKTITTANPKTASNGPTTNPSSSQSSPTTTKEETPQQTSTVWLFTGPKKGQSSYNLQKLNEAVEADLEQAKNFKQKLQLLGNYFKKKTETDWSGALAGLTQMAQGARLGTKMMGT